MRKILLAQLIATFFSVQIAAAQTNIMPKPVDVSISKGTYTLPKKIEIYAPKQLNSEAEMLKAHLASNKAYKVALSNQMTKHANIKLMVTDDNFVKDEGYTLEVSKKGITIKAANDKGIFYGIQTLLQILPPTVYDKASNARWSIPCLNIVDYPRFEYRGMMLDLARQFFSLDYVRQYIDWLAMHKINRFHMHLTDDEGWRIEIKKYPILTEKGAWRGDNELLAPAHGSGSERYGGFYTQDELKEVVKYAAERKIEIIPEIEFPGHCKAVTQCFPDSYCNTVDSSLSATNYRRNVVCPSKEENYKMIEDILDEVCAIFPSKYIHIGGDEVNTSSWKTCPLCQAKMKEMGFTSVQQLRDMFNLRIGAMVAKHNKLPLGWEELVNSNVMPTTTAIISWKGIKPGEKAAKNGYKVIFAPAQHLYLDMKQSLTERGHGWCNITPLTLTYKFEPFADSTFTDAEKQNVMGVQGTLFGEYLNAPAHFAEYQTYPRLCALSEIGWTPQASRSFDDFNSRLIAGHYTRMQHMGIHYRVTPPALSYANGKIEATAEAGTVIRAAKYTEPTISDPIVNGPIATDTPSDYIFKAYANDTLASAPMYIFPQEACSWNPTTIKSETFVDREADITNSINGNGQWDVQFMFVSGYGKVCNVELYENGTLIGSDSHTANIQINYKDIDYPFEIKNYSKDNKYVVKYQIKGTSTEGKMYLLRRNK